VSENDGKDVFERMVERVLAYRPKSRRKKKRKAKIAKKSKQQKP
jgi:hypothetical protein